MKTTIKRNGQEVDCFGKFDVTCNVQVIFDDEMMDGIVSPEMEDTSWTDMVERWTKHAVDNNMTVVQMEMV